MGFACFIRIFNVKKDAIIKAFDHALSTVYGSGSLPKGTRIEIGEWKGKPQIEIFGAGQDSRCAFCEYFIKEIGENNIRRNNCPFH